MQLVENGETYYRELFFAILILRASYLGVQQSACFCILPFPTFPQSFTCLDRLTFGQHL
jgi:hypothetical protein